MSLLRDALRKPAHFVLYNFIVEALVVSVVATVYVVLRAADRVFRTRLKMVLIDAIHDLSRDSLSPIRKAQIGYLFKRKYGLKKIRIRLAGGNYWMSIPCVVEGVDRKAKVQRKYMGKIINDRSALKHRYMTILRRLGVLTEGASLEFMDHEDAQDMVEFERNWMILLKNRGISVPEVYGIHRLNHDDYILVMQFIEGTPLSKVALDEAIVDQIFDVLRVMHETGIFHGDVKLDNFLFANGKIYVVDSLKINHNDPLRAHEFDLICAICALAQKLPVRMIIEAAARHHPREELEHAGEMLGLALYKVDLELPEEKVGEIRRALEGMKVKA